MSRSLDDLKPVVRDMALKLVEGCRAQSIDLLVTCTSRTMSEQAALYQQGRTVPGLIVTNAKPGESLHQFGLAFDVVPLRNGKPVWGTKGLDLLLWQQVGRIGESVGLEWAGRWTKFKEFPHFQLSEK